MQELIRIEDEEIAIQDQEPRTNGGRNERDLSCAKEDEDQMGGNIIEF